MLGIFLAVLSLLAAMVALNVLIISVFKTRKVARNFVRYIVFDVETSGLSSVKNGVLEIAARAWDGREFQSFVCPWAGCEFEAKAMEINGLYEYLLHTSEFGAMQALQAWLKNFEKGWMFVAASPAFDYAFLEAIQERTGVKLGLDYHKMDVQSMALLLHMRGEIKLPVNEKTGAPVVKADALFNYYGLARSSEIHGALEDVRLEAALLEAML